MMHFLHFLHYKTPRLLKMFIFSSSDRSWYQKLLICSEEVVILCRSAEGCCWFLSNSLLQTWYKRTCRWYFVCFKFKTNKTHFFCKIFNLLLSLVYPEYPLKHLSYNFKPHHPTAWHSSSWPNSLIYWSDFLPNLGNLSCNLRGFDCFGKQFYLNLRHSWEDRSIADLPLYHFYDC